MSWWSRCPVVLVTLVAADAAMAQNPERADLLGPTLATQLPPKSALRKRILPGAHNSERICVLLDEDLRNEDSARALFQEWSAKPGRDRLPDMIEALLCETKEAKEATVLDDALRRVMEVFFEEFVSDVYADGRNLRHALEKYPTASRMTLVVAATDVECWMDRETGKLMTEVTLRIFRLRVSEVGERPIERVERIFMARASGAAEMPVLAPSESQSWRVKVEAAYEKAIWNSIEKKIAVYLWGEPRLVENAWNVAPRARVEVAYRSLNQEPIEVSR